MKGKILWCWSEKADQQEGEKGSELDSSRRASAGGISSRTEKVWIQYIVVRKWQSPRKHNLYSYVIMYTKHIIDNGINVFLNVNNSK